MKEKDIFDKLMALPGLCVFEPFYQKNKEMLLYLFFGGMTFMISILSYALFNGWMGINELIANVFSWTVAVLFAYVTNRTWVFEETGSGRADVLQELARFLSGRLVTLGMEELILLVFITWMHWNSMAVKIAAQILVIIFNYVISKLFVFRKAHG